MPVTAVVGAQWGDEGKGKVVDTLADHADFVIRYNGGNNAGHTIQNQHGTFRLHLLPSGIFHPAAQCVIGPGVVVNPDVLLDEIAEVERVGIPTIGRLWVSDRAHVIFPHHIVTDELEEAAREAARGGSAHGTTKQGIWPVYSDKVARIGIRVGDLSEEAHLAEQLEFIAARKSALLRGTYRHEPVDASSLLSACARWRERLRPYIADTHALIQEALRADRAVLLEGQLGVMRDLDWGLYPFVTSSTTLPGGACAGAGVPPYRITRVLGVAKAYTTAVGSGPMPTELHDAAGDRMRELGQEFGATTRRPRRCGWFDGVAARFAAEVAGFTHLAVMKLDIFDTFETIRIGVAYRLGERTLHTVPHTAVMSRVEPVYEDLPGWRRATQGARRLTDLPVEARTFLRRIEEIVGVPIAMIGVGPERSDVVFCLEGFA
ncbi:MAG TPA: adenylosuccinate synthase [bacterium]|nr:adenylosuccinate synthase [bacterium]